jgi:hypothetical protein
MELEGQIKGKMEESGNKLKEVSAKLENMDG